MKKTKKISSGRKKQLKRTVIANLKAMSRAGDWMGPRGDNKLGKEKPAGAIIPQPIPRSGYEPDSEFEKLATASVKSPVSEFHEDLMNDKVVVKEAWMFEGKCDARGKLIENKAHMEQLGLVVPFRIRHVTGEQFKEAMRKSDATFKEAEARTGRLEEAKRRHLELVESLKKDGKLQENFNTDTIERTYDVNQYTEYTPLYAGPFNKQLYTYDYLQMHARAFEARNHNPLAKRIVDILSQYAFGRRFKVQIKNARKQKIWDEANREHKIIHKVAEYWSKEYLTYGELMVDKTRWQSIDPSTVWDIITDPDDISKVYYYYQSYSTAFQTFTGYKVPGEPGSNKQPGLEYIIRQLPAFQIMHMKGNVVSQEKRGRSILFPILGWLKRVKDLYNAQVIQAQLQAAFIWDDTIDGSAGDVAAHAAQYAAMPTPASVFVHNKAVERKAMPAVEGRGAGAGGGAISDNIMSFIATAVGMPANFFNVMGQGGGNRATALVGAEPFEKVIEDLQAKFENLLHEIAEEIFIQAGVGYEQGDIEFTFPSVTKDTTSETIKNVMLGETQGYISHEKASKLFATEMNDTTYDYEKEQKAINDDHANGLDPLMPPGGRFGNPAPDNGSVPDDESPIHGTGKKNLKAQLNNV